MKPNTIARIRTAGLSHNVELVVHSVRASCGDIFANDGIGVHFENFDIRGTFLLSFQDLEAAYLAIVKEREAIPAPCDAAYAGDNHRYYDGRCAGCGRRPEKDSK